jgi:hypothetical protein
LSDQEEASERVDVWLADAVHEATEGLWLLQHLTKMPPTPARLDAAALRLLRAADACRRAMDLLEDAQQRSGGPR